MDVNTANQSTTDEQMMDILLVLDKEKKTISAVKGVDENGELQTVPPENNSEPSRRFLFQLLFQHDEPVEEPDPLQLLQNPEVGTSQNRADNQG